MKAIYLPLFFSGFRDFLNHPSRLAASGANLFFFVRLCFAIFILYALAQFYAKAIFVMGNDYFLDSSCACY